MVKMLAAIYKNTKLRRQILYTLGILVVFRIGASVTIPGVVVQDQFQTNSFLGIINMLGGGALSQFSLFALGISPYITSSIVVQLLASDVIPSWKRHLQTGENGRRQLAIITKRFTLFLAIFQGFTLTRAMSLQKLISLEKTPFWYVMVVLVTGAMATIFLGDRISQKGVGNGVSIIIFSGIVASLPYQIYQTFQIFVNAETAQALFTGLLNFSFYILAWYLVIAFMVYVDQAQRKIPVQYPSRLQITRKEEISFLPLKVNVAGVIPIIFASAIILAPQTIAGFFEGKEWANWIIKYFTFTNPWTYSAYLAMIFGFTYFQAFTFINPNELAENLNKSSAFIPGIRSGEETKNYVRKIISRICFFGGIFLVVVAALPRLVGEIINVQTPLVIGGSGLIIVAGVALELFRQIKGQLFQASYTGLGGNSFGEDPLGSRKTPKVEW